MLQAWTQGLPGKLWQMVHAHNNLPKKTENQASGNTVGSFTPRAHWSNRNTTTCSVRFEDEKLPVQAPGQLGSVPAVVQTVLFG